MPCSKDDCVHISKGFHMRFPSILGLLVSLVVIFNWELADSAVKGVLRYLAGL